MSLYLEKVLNTDVISIHTKELHFSVTQRVMLGTSSKGNQLKWYNRSAGIFAKVDLLGYESIAEIMVAWLCKYILNLKIPYVEYYPCRIYENGRYVGVGCCSKDFKRAGETEKTFSKLLQDNLATFSIHYDELRDLLLNTTNVDIKDYLDSVLYLDKITYNGDRHFNNLHLIERDGVYRLGCIFDNGDALLSDYIMYPKNEDINELCKRVTRKPFAESELIQNNELFVIDYEALAKSIEPWSGEAERAFHVLMKGLKESEGLVWKRL